MTFFAVQNVRYSHLISVCSGTLNFATSVRIVAKTCLFMLVKRNICQDFEDRFWCLPEKCNRQNFVRCTQWLKWLMSGWKEEFSLTSKFRNCTQKESKKGIHNKSKEAEQEKNKVSRARGRILHLVFSTCAHVLDTQHTLNWPSCIHTHP